MNHRASELLLYFMWIHRSSRPCVTISERGGMTSTRATKRDNICKNVRGQRPGTAGVATSEWRPIRYSNRPDRLSSSSIPVLRAELFNGDTQLTIGRTDCFEEMKGTNGWVPMLTRARLCQFCCWSLYSASAFSANQRLRKPSLRHTHKHIQSKRERENEREIQRVDRKREHRRHRDTPQRGHTLTEREREREGRKRATPFGLGFLQFDPFLVGDLHALHARR